jgi:hypothetical protein
VQNVAQWYVLDQRGRNRSAECISCANGIDYLNDGTWRKVFLSFGIQAGTSSTTRHDQRLLIKSLDDIEWMCHIDQLLQHLPLFLIQFGDRGIFQTLDDDLIAVIILPQIDVEKSIFAFVPRSSLPTLLTMATEMPNWRKYHAKFKGAPPRYSPSSNTS